MPNYSLRSRSILEQNNSDQSIGSFENRDIALEALNRQIEQDGRPCNAQITIKAFAFKLDVGSSTLCDREYYLVEILLQGKEVEHRLLPKGSLGIDPLKTTNAAGSFAVFK